MMMVAALPLIEVVRFYFFDDLLSLELCEMALVLIGSPEAKNL